MKRTKELYFRPHPEPPMRAGISGAKEFDGEDLGNSVSTKANFTHISSIHIFRV